MKADAATTYSKTEVDAAIAVVQADVDQNEQDADSAIALKADQSTTYSKTEVDSAVALRVLATDYTAKQNSQDALILANTAKAGFTNALVASAPSVVLNTAKYSTAAVDSALALKRNAADSYTKAQVDSAVALRVLTTDYTTKQNSQDALISNNTSKTGFTNALVASAPSVVLNTAKYSTAAVDSALALKQNALTDASGLNINSTNAAIGKAVVAGGTRLAVKGHAFFEHSGSTRGLRIHSGKIIEANHAISDAIDMRVHGAGCFRVSRYAGGAVNVVASIGQAATTVNSTAIIFSALPTSDPGVSGQLWNSGGTLKISP